MNVNDCLEKIRICKCELNYKGYKRRAIIARKYRHMNLKIQRVSLFLNMIDRKEANWDLQFFKWISLELIKLKNILST